MVFSHHTAASRAPYHGCASSRRAAVWPWPGRSAESEPRSAGRTAVTPTCTAPEWPAPAPASERRSGCPQSAPVPAQARGHRLPNTGHDLTLRTPRNTGPFTRGCRRRNYVFDSSSHTLLDVVLATSPGRNNESKNTCHPLPERRRQDPLKAERSLYRGRGPLMSIGRPTGTLWCQMEGPEG